MAVAPQSEEENAVAFLNSYATKNGKTAPSYKEKEVRGEPHKRTFSLTCEFIGIEVNCEGKSKKDAKRACAVSMVGKMREAGLLTTSQSVEYEPVSVLQQLLQKKNYPLPKYEEVEESGPSHCKQFSIRVTAVDPDNRPICESSIATANSKKEAKKKAANDLLIRVKPLLDNSPIVRQQTTTYSSGDILSSLNISMNTQNEYKSFTAREAHQSSHFTTASTTRDRHFVAASNSLNTAMASLSMEQMLHDKTDGLVKMPDDIDIDVVYVDTGSDGKNLCLATVSHAGEKITGCGIGSTRENARHDAVDQLQSNFNILFSSF